MPPTPRPSNHPCPGPCNRAWRRAETNAAKTGTPHTLHPEPGEPLWCHRCATLVYHCLNEIPALLAAIHLEALHGTPTPGARVHHTHQTPPWPGEAARILTDLIIGGLTEIETVMRDLRGWSPRPELPEGRAVTTAVTILSNSLDWILTHYPDAGCDTESPGIRILTWQRMAIRFTKADTPRAQVKDLPCPGDKCGLLTLVATPGTDSIECGNCGLILREEEYQRRVKQYAIFEKAKQAA